MKKTVILFSLSLFACEGTFKTSECADTNWRERGYADGLSGQDHNILDSYTRKCKGVDIVPHEGMYVAGYLEGVKLYCSEEIGFARGEKGGKPGSMCPGDSKYAIGYKKGRIAYAKEKERRAIERLTRPSSNSEVGAATDAGPTM